MADVTVEYKSTTIAEMSAAGTKTLKTGGKYCEGDISVRYEKPIASEVPSGMNIKYIIPASYVPVRTSDDMGFDATQFTFTRENVNQFFRVDWILQDEADFDKGGYWVQSLQWLLYETGNYATQHVVFISIGGSGKKGNLSPVGKAINYAKTALTGNISVGSLTATSAGYERWGTNYKGVIIIYDRSYNGKPIVDASKLSQFFSDCNGQLTEGW